MAELGLDLRVEEVAKQFGETRALSEVSLSVLPGSVHALIGENGAGKSTLGRIMAGVIRPDSGRLLVDGEAVEFDSPKHALDRGIAMIAQEIALVPALDAAANVLLGVEPRKLGFLNRGQLRDRFGRLASSAGFEVPADRPVGSLSIAQQQEVEILRALARDARLIVMDEPTARLSMAETEKLHEVIRKLAADGRSVLLISHFLDEVLSVADEMTILRDGRVVRHGPTSAETRGTCIEAMLGRKLGAQFPDQQLPPAEAPVVLQAVGLSGPGFSDVSLTLRAGEIVGLAGLVGAGRSEFARAVIGAAPTTAGRIEIGGSVARFRTPRQGLSEGLVMIPESRRDQGLFYLRPTRENVSVSSLGQFTRLGIVQMGRERRATGEMLGRVSVNASAETPLTTLSGGNQQKVLFARAMLTRPAALLADEPTRGVDIGAKRAIYDILVGLAAEGLAILLISSEMEEIIGLAHRVVVMRGGRVTAELAGDQISQQRILHAAFEAQLDEPMALPA